MSSCLLLQRIRLATLATGDYVYRTNCDRNRMDKKSFAAGDAVLEAAPRPEQPTHTDSEAEAHQQGSQPVSQDSEADTAFSTDSASNAHTYPPHFQPEPQAADSAQAEHGLKPSEPDSDPLSHESQSKLQQLLSWLPDRHWFSQPSDLRLPGTSEPDTPSLSLEQPETAQLELLGSARQESTQPALTDDAESDTRDPSMDTHQAVEPVLLSDLIASSEMFLWGAASAIAAWLLSSLLLRCLASTPPHPPIHSDDGEESALPEEEDREASPDVMYSASPEEAEATAMGTEQPTGVVTRARSVARSMSEAVSGLMTSRSEMPGEEEGHEAESAPGGVGASGSVRGRRARGRRELAALGTCS